MNSSDSSYYVVVEFIEETKDGDTPIGIVSSNWLHKDSRGVICNWPKCRTDGQMQKLVEMHSDVSNGLECIVNIKYKSKIYQKALEKMNLLRHELEVSQTDIEENDDAKKRRLKKNSRLIDYASDVDSSDDDLPIPPRLSKDILGITENASKFVQTPSSGKSNIASFSACNSSNLPDAELLANYEVDHEVNSQENGNIQNNNIQSLANGTYLCNGCKLAEDLLPKILEKLDRLSDDMKYVMLCQQQSSDVGEMRMEFSSCGTKEELLAFETSLTEEKTFQSMCLLFQTVGGKDTVDTTRRILAKLLKNDLAILYNWSGRNNKEQFSNLQNVLKLILVAVRRNPLSKNATVKEIEQIVKYYLRNSMDRQGGRGQRVRPNDDL